MVRNLGKQRRDASSSGMIRDGGVGYMREVYLGGILGFGLVKCMYSMYSIFPHWFRTLPKFGCVDDRWRDR